MWPEFDSRLPDAKEKSPLTRTLFLCYPIFMSHLIRTRFKQDIVAEIGLPKEPNGKLIILLQGCPSMPSQATQRFLMKRGFVVVQPRYRGTWESSGLFLEVSPEQDVIDILDDLNGELVDAWSKEAFHVEHDEVIIICSSFGGAAGILASRDPRVSKVVAFLEDSKVCMPIHGGFEVSLSS